MHSKLHTEKNGAIYEQVYVTTNGGFPPCKLIILHEGVEQSGETVLAPMS